MSVLDQSQPELTRFEFVLGMLDEHERLKIERLISARSEISRYLEAIFAQVPVTAGPGFLRLLIWKFGLFTRRISDLPSVLTVSGEKIEPQKLDQQVPS